MNRFETTISTVGITSDGGTNWTSENKQVVVEWKEELEDVVIRIDDNEYTIPTIEKLLSHMQYLKRMEES